VWGRTRESTRRARRACRVSLLRQSRASGGRGGGRALTDAIGAVVSGSRLRVGHGPGDPRGGRALACCSRLLPPPPPAAAACCRACGPAVLRVPTAAAIVWHMRRRSAADVAGAGYPDGARHGAAGGPAQHSGRKGSVSAPALPLLEALISGASRPHTTAHTCTRLYRALRRCAASRSCPVSHGVTGRVREDRARRCVARRAPGQWQTGTPCRHAGSTQPSTPHQRRTRDTPYADVHGKDGGVRVDRGCRGTVEGDA
jgi:hypothetical protein